MNICKTFMLSAFAAASFIWQADAAAPANYYSSCENKGGKDLLVALSGVVASHTTVSYDALLDLYKTSDVYPDGTIWDMYSTKHWSTGEKCGSYKNVGDCYNREHSFPKSWFNDKSPMVSDAFHIYPTDGKVNGQRSNFPYGECANGQTLAGSGSVKALGKLGTSTFPGYTGKVFEPVDEYKGDFARSYFYMAACYNSQIAGWSSDMLAKNNYPVFTTWAIDLLLKWHRMDPVSEKELKRQEVVYGRQRNRNPFIDHPELAEYIWGDKKDMKWTSTGVLETSINQPANNSSLNVGVSAVNVAIESKVNILTTNATEPVKLSISGQYFTVSPSTVTAAAANAGTQVTVKYTPAAVGTHAASLYVTCGDAKSTLNLTGSAVDGLPVAEATQIGDESFVVTWTYIGDADASGNYTLDVKDDAGSLPGYPKAVPAAKQSFTVTGLTPETDYTYTLKSQTLSSAVFNVRTAEALPSIDFLYDGELIFSAEPGDASEPAEILIATENIEHDYTIAVVAPFELSLDRSNWTRTVTVTPDDTRIYLRFNSATEGTFYTSLTATYGDYVSDDAAAMGKAASTPAFIEDFENTGSYSTYSAQTYNGSACVWNLVDAGIWANDPVHGGDQSLRAGRSTQAIIEMAEDRNSGLGTLSFYASRFRDDAESEYDVQYSTDGGNTYKSAGTVKITSTDFEKYSCYIGVSGKARMRLVQKSGKRIYIDDIAITDKTSGLDEPAALRHQWDAFSVNGILNVTIDNADGLDCAIYAVDGRTVFAGHLAEGTHTFDTLAPGTVCIVHIADFSRTVIIR